MHARAQTQDPALHITSIDNLTKNGKMARQRAGDVTIYKNTGFGSQDYAQEIRPVLPQRWAFLEQARHFVHS